MREQSKKYYYQKQLDEIERIKGFAEKPSLLMHTCCIVCACWPIEYLSQHFDLTLYYNNDNIYPQEEYEKRYAELVRYVEKHNAETGNIVHVIKTPYNGKEYLVSLIPYKDEPEGGKRCELCYELRMDSAMKYAEENGYDYFTTVMTISRQKNSIVLNKIGEKLQDRYPEVRYFFSDFKKDGGTEKSNRIVSENNLYRQNYCGCLFSWQEMLERARKDMKKNDLSVG